ncbi:MAG: hypothetical protein ACFCD0_22160 [Gemmataceae bacterium]
MTVEPNHDSDVTQLLSQLIDGELSSEAQERLITLLGEDDRHAKQLVDHVLLDSLLAEEIGPESLIELVDHFPVSGSVFATTVRHENLHDLSAREFVDEKVATYSEKTDASAVGESTKDFATGGVTSHDQTTAPSQSPWKSRFLALLSITALTVVVLLLVGRWNQPAYASPSAVVRAAIDTHGQPIERIYLVDVKQEPSLASAVAQDARIATQGNRFWVEMKHSRKRWAWGQNPDGAIWLVLGRHRSIHLGSEEVGEPLKQIAEIYSLRLESLLQEVLRDFDLKQTRVDEVTHVIVARSRGGHPRWLRRAKLEIGSETKAIRRLVMDRRFGNGRTSTITFTLVETRVADTQLFRPEGHLLKPFVILDQDSKPDRRSDVLRRWFGPMAARWLRER